MPMGGMGLGSWGTKSPGAEQGVSQDAADDLAHLRQSYGAELLNLISKDTESVS